NQLLRDLLDTPKEQFPTPRSCAQNLASSAGRSSDPCELAFVSPRYWPEPANNGNAAEPKSQCRLSHHQGSPQTSTAIHENPGDKPRPANTAGKCLGSRLWFRNPKVC